MIIVLYPLIFGIGFGVFYLGTILLTLLFDIVIGVENRQLVIRYGWMNWFGGNFVNRLAQVLVLAVLQFFLSIIVWILLGLFVPIDPCCWSFPYSDLFSTGFYLISIIISFFVVNCTWLLYLLFLGVKYSK